MVIRGDELLFDVLLLGVNMTLDATVTLFLSFFPPFFAPFSYRESFTLYNFLFNHLDRPFVNHLNLHLSTCPIMHFL